MIVNFAAGYTCQVFGPGGFTDSKGTSLLNIKIRGTSKPASGPLYPEHKSYEALVVMDLISCELVMPEAGFQFTTAVAVVPLVT